MDDFTARFYGYSHKVTAKAFNSVTRQCDIVETFYARNRQEAINWKSFNKDWMKDFQITELEG